MFTEEVQAYAKEWDYDKIDLDLLERLLLEYTEASGFQYVKLPELQE